jgi:hypothetical protein
LFSAGGYSHNEVQWEGTGTFASVKDFYRKATLPSGYKWGDVASDKADAFTRKWTGPGLEGDFSIYAFTGAPVSATFRLTASD